MYTISYLNTQKKSVETIKFDGKFYGLLIKSKNLIIKNVCESLEVSQKGYGIIYRIYALKQVGDYERIKRNCIGQFFCKMKMYVLYAINLYNIKASVILDGTILFTGIMPSVLDYIILRYGHSESEYIIKDINTDTLYFIGTPFTLVTRGLLND